MSRDIPELRRRLAEILDIELELESNPEKQRATVSHPPPVGLPVITKLTGYFMDQIQLNTMLFCCRAITATPYSGTRKESAALLRTLAIIGESSKFLTSFTKEMDGTIPWKNIEKVSSSVGNVTQIHFLGSRFTQSREPNSNEGCSKFLTGK